MRLFIGLEPSQAQREALMDLEAELDGARWIEADDLHLTLVFLGQVSAEQAAGAHEELAAIRAAPVRLRLKGLGSFGKGRRMRALWAAAEPAAELLSLQKKALNAVRRAGLEPERRKFVPHVTLARLKAPEPRQIGRYIAANNLFPAPEAEIGHFTLFRSHLDESGARYEALHRYRLGDAGRLTAGPHRP